MENSILTKKYGVYPKYKNSGVAWLWPIPYSWSVKKGKILFMGKKEVNKGLKCENVLSLTMGGVLHRSELGEGGLLPESYETFQLFEKDDLVFKLIDLENYKTSRVGIVPERGIMSSAYIRITKNNADIIPKFAYYFYYDLYVRGIYNFLGMGVRSTLNQWDLLQIPIPIPSIEEQKKIIKFLDISTGTVGSLIEKKQKQIELLKEKRAAIINQIVTRGIGLDPKFIDSGIDWLRRIPKGWKLKKLKHLSNRPLRYGFVGAPDDFTGDQSNGVRYIRITDILDNGRLERDNARFLSKKTVQEYILEDKDLLFARTGATVGKAFLYEKKMGEACFAGYLIQARLNRNEILPEYVYFVTKSSFYNTWKNSIFIQSTIQNINAEKYGNLIIPIPPLDEQKEIVRLVSFKDNAFDNVIAGIQKSIDFLREFKGSLISSAVTGKIKV